MTYPYRPSPTVRIKTAPRRITVLLIFTTVFALSFGVVFLGNDGCSGTQSPPSPTSWVPVAQGIASDLTIAVPGAKVVADSLLTDPTQRQAADLLFTAAEGTLPGLNSALANYALSPTSTNACLVRAAMELVAQSLLAVGNGLAGIGFETPAIILTSLGGLGSIIDGQLPACTPDAGIGMQAQINLMYAHRPAGLRKFPEASSGSHSP